MTVEIIGERLDLVFEELDISATKTYQTEEDWLETSYQVWELSHIEYKKLNSENIEWKPEYGWWRNSGCNNMGDKYEFLVNGNPMIGFMEEDNYIHDRECYDLEEGEEIPQIKFNSLHEYLDGYIAISKPVNYAYFIHSLAELNGMKKSEVFKMYW